MNEEEEGLRGALPKKKLIVNAVLLVAALALVSLFFHYEDFFLSGYQQGVIAVSFLGGWLFFCSCMLIVACVGLLRSVRLAWREGKWSEYGFTIAVWVAAVAFVWFVMDVPGLWGRMMEYA